MASIVNTWRHPGNLWSCSSGHLLCLDAKTGHEEALYNVRRSRSSMLLHFVCVCMQARAGLFVFDSVCLLLVALSVKFSECSGGGGEETVCWRSRRSVAIRFCNDDASIRREVFASLCSSLWLHAVLCVLCFLFLFFSPKVWHCFFGGTISERVHWVYCPQLSVVVCHGWRDGVLGVFASRSAMLLAMRLCEGSSSCCKRGERAILCQKRQPWRGLVGSSWSNFRWQ